MIDDELEYDNEKSIQIARCEKCGEPIYDNNKNFYVNDNGEYFCGISCVLEFYSVHLCEDCMVN